MADTEASDPVTPDNWRTPPHHHDAFHRVAEILTTAPIPALGRPWVLAEAPKSFVGFSVSDFGGVTHALPAFLEATDTDALVILHRGRIVFEHYGHGTTRTTPHILMSVSKAMTGLIAGILAKGDEIDLDAPVSTLVPEIAATAYQGATLRQLIDMRVGVAPTPEQAAAYDAALHSAPNGQAFRAILAQLTTAKAEHGGVFSYISANTDLAAWAMERATGQSMAALFTELLWTPLGAEHEAQLIVDRQGAPWCSGGLNFTARDFARVGQLLLQEGQRDGATIVPSAWVDDLITGGDRAAWTDGEWGQVFAPISPAMSYRAGWYTIDQPPPGLLFAMGTHGQNLFIDREHQVVIAKLSSQSRFDYRAVALTHRAVPELVRVASA